MANIAAIRSLGEIAREAREIAADCQSTNYSPATADKALRQVGRVARLLAATIEEMREMEARNG